MNFDSVIQERRSVRHFTDKAVEAEKIEALLRCAALSPSAKNRQPWYFSILECEEKNNFARLLNEYAEKAGNKMAMQTADIIIDASVLILVFSGKDRPEPSFTDILSAGGAMYSICLKATDLGLGSLWIGDTDILAEDFEASAGCGRLYGAIAIGYSERHYAPRPRKPFDTITNLKNASVKEHICDSITALDLGDDNYAFCSYSHKDYDIVVSDMIALQRHNVPIWYDRWLSVGERWDDNALKILCADNCRAMILYISANSIVSEPVARELEAAMKRKSRDPEFAIIPVHIGGELLSDIISGVKENDSSITASPFIECFGNDDSVLFISRDVYPSSQKHLTDVIDKFASLGIVKSGRVYDNFAYEIEQKKYAVITRYLGFSETVMPPSEISGYPVVKIGDGAFAGNDRLVECILPLTVRSIGAGAFRECSKLMRVEIPGSVTEIGVACFRECTALKSINLPDGITVLNEAVFRGCTALEQITVPEGVTELGEAVFRHCHSLVRAVLPDSLLCMTEGGFFDCPSLVELIIPEGIAGLEASSFNTSPLLRRTVAGGFVFEKGKSYPL